MAAGVGRVDVADPMTDLILGALSRREATPRLVVALSMETHGPYRQTKGIDRGEFDAVQVPAKLDAGEAESLWLPGLDVRHR